MRWYVYVYYDEDHQPYYVGKGCGYRAHYRRDAIPVPPRERMVFRYFDDEQRAFQLEKDLIAFWGRKDLDPSGRLMNICTGGPGAPGLPVDNRGKSNPFYGKRHSLSSRKKMSALKRGFKRSPDSIRKQVAKIVKDFVITLPDGTEEQITNLSRYCKSKGLDTGHMVAIAKGSRKSHKGYKCRYA